MDVEPWRILMVMIAIVNGNLVAQMLEDINMQKQTLPMDACDTILVSHSGIYKGKKKSAMLTSEK